MNRVKRSTQVKCPDCLVVGNRYIEHKAQCIPAIITYLGRIRETEFEYRAEGSNRISTGFLGDSGVIPYEHGWNQTNWLELLDGCKHKYHQCYDCNTHKAYISHNTCFITKIVHSVCCHKVIHSCCCNHSCED